VVSDDRARRECAGVPARGAAGVRVLRTFFRRAAVGVLLRVDVVDWDVVAAAAAAAAAVPRSTPAAVPRSTPAAVPRSTLPAEPAARGEPAADR
jgi:hypothetical protein